MAAEPYSGQANSELNFQTAQVAYQSGRHSEVAEMVAEATERLDESELIAEAV